MVRFLSPARWLGLLLFSSLLAGCGKGNFYEATDPADVTPSTGPPYHSFGDSITFGFDLPHPATQAYAAIVAAARTRALSNYGISGDQSCDVPTRQIFAHAEQPTTAQAILYSLLIGTNDVGHAGTGPYEAVFNLCQQASIAWLALPLQDKTVAGSATVAGRSHVETSNNWNAVFTDAAGASLTFTFNRATAGPVYVWYRILDGNPGTFTYALDGAQPGFLTTGTSPAMKTQNGTTDSLALLRIPAVSPGAHTLVLLQTSPGASGLGVVALGLPPMTAAANMPRVLVGSIPPQNRDQLSPCSPNMTSCQAYTADITANVALLAGDGLNVELFNPGKYMTANNADFSDTLHPNVIGHQEMAHALEDIY